MCKNIYKGFGLIVLTIMIYIMFPAKIRAEVLYHGACGVNGDNLTWAFEDNGILTINGSGEMMDYASSDEVPWFSLRQEIVGLSLGNGVTKIGNYAFYECNIKL